MGLLAAFALAIVGFRGRRFLPGRTRSKLLIESWSMVVFITGVLWFTGKGASPLFNLYLLPIILSALTLGRVITLLQVAAIAVCHLLLAMTTPGLEVISLFYASQVVGQLAPFLLGGLSHHHLVGGHHRSAGTNRKSGADRFFDRTLQRAHVQRSVAA